MNTSAHKSTEIIKVVLLCVFLGTNYLYAKGLRDISDAEYTQALNMIEIFYIRLSENKEPSEFCNILHEECLNDDGSLNQFSEEILKFILNHKSVMIYDHSVDCRQTFDKALKSYILFNVRERDSRLDGYLQIGLTMQMQNAPCGTLMKEIIFPFKVTDEGKYKISLYNLRVNGMLLDEDFRRRRSYDLIHQLGFPEIETTKKEEGSSRQ